MREPQTCQIQYKGYPEPGDIDEIIYEQSGIKVAISALQLRFEKLTQMRNELVRREMAAQKQASETPEATTVAEGNVADVTSEQAS